MTSQGAADPPAPGLAIYPVRGLPLFTGGEDLAAVVGDALAAQGLAPQNGDVIVLAQKVVSKAEHRTRLLEDVSPSPRAQNLAVQTGKSAALVELALDEAKAVMRAKPGVLIIRHRSGHVTANSGIDTSNVAETDGPETVLLWPLDADASAAKVRKSLEARFGAALAVVISDSLGRAWRMGTMGTAIGSSGLKPLRDRRGETDLFGRTLQATLIGVADEIAAAASLVIGEAAEGVPAALVRGAVYDRDEAAGISEIIRPADQDLFP